MEIGIFVGMQKNGSVYSWVRLLGKVGSVLALGLGFHLLVDLVFGLRYRNYPFHWHWGRFGTDLMLAFLILAGSQYLNKKLNQLLPWDKSLLRRLVGQSLAQITWIILVVSGIRNVFFRSILHPSPVFINLTDEILLAGVMLLISVLVVAVELGFFLLNKWRISLAQLERFKKENIEFHLEMLKTQVNPHFLFNNLNALSSLIYSNQDMAAEFVRQLAKVYRYVLESRAKELVTLSEELTLLQSYIYLMELRFGNNLRIRVSLPDALQHYSIAPLTLQMLIENAIKHNIVSQKKPLDVFIFQEQNYLVVQNSLQLKPIKEFSSRIGLKNIVNRYRFITETPISIIDDGIMFMVKIPLLEQNRHLKEGVPAISE